MRKAVLPKMVACAGLKHVRSFASGCFVCCAVCLGSWFGLSFDWFSLLFAEDAMAKEREVRKV